ncbi:MAG: DUF433 domain-containing protein [Planctomycetes bacterium]|nr:DUF433 domain-containing protein [Planctomycetota bacterium]
MILPDFLTQDADGEVRLMGHRVGLYSVVRSYQEGHSAEQIHAEFPSLSLAHVYKVLAFYLENRPEVDAYATAYREELEQQSKSLRQGPSREELQRRWQEKGLGSLP